MNKEESNIAEQAKIFIKEHRKIIIEKILNYSKTTHKTSPKQEEHFSAMSSSKQKKIIEKAAQLSAKDQEKLLKKYEEKFGQKQFFTK
ncbi:MAG: hypothetical protein IPN70_04805 [Candidatus Moraniibacteriota bacterium]|nr:MAG: hypothetical protein IPN70_04805 [Candidatus Moranbacteria bacterium]